MPSLPNPHHPHASAPVSGPQTVLLQTAIAAFVASQPPTPAHGYLYALDEYLGAPDQLPAPLLAYTKLTGEAWLRTLEAQKAAEAAPLLAHFRAFLRDGGWFDAARPVNLFD